MTQIVFNCDRCGAEVHGGIYRDLTAGFYSVGVGKAWHKYALSDDEIFVCDACIQAMPLYREQYGWGGPPA